MGKLLTISFILIAILAGLLVLSVIVINKTENRREDEE